MGRSGKRRLAAIEYCAMPTSAAPPGDEEGNSSVSDSTLSEAAASPAEPTRTPVAPAPAPAHGIWMAIYVAVLVGKFSDWVPGLSEIPLAKIAFLFTAIYTYRIRATLAPVRVRSLPIARPAIAFLTLAIVSIFFSVYRSASLIALYSIVIYLLSFVLLIKITQSQRDVERLLMALCVAGAALALAVVVTYHGGRARINSNFNANDLSYGIVTLLPITWALRCTGAKGRRRLIYPLSLAMIGAVLLTGSRGGTIAMSVVILLIIAFPLGFAQNGELKRFRAARTVTRLVIVLIAGAVIWGHLPGAIRAQLGTLTDLENDYNANPNSSASRLAIWARDSRAVIDRPIGFGVGSGEYVDGMTGGAYRAQHNSLVQSLVELGVLGLVLFLCSYYITFKQLGRISRAARSADAEAARAALYARAIRIGLVGNFIAGFFLSQAYSELLWMTVAICAAFVRISLPNNQSAASVLARA
jgi:O-antigen ligase